MIRTIGVLCQDRNSFGFVDGLRRRLGCAATLVEPGTGNLAKSSTMTNQQARIATQDLRKKGVDLIVRFTDADASRWQDVRRHEIGAFPQEIHAVLVVGVAIDNTEQWLALHRQYLSDELRRRDYRSLSGRELTDAIKADLSLADHLGERSSDRTSSLVANAPKEVFRTWLQADESLRRFYDDCRQAAKLAECDIPNELNSTDD